MDNLTIISLAALLTLFIYMLIVANKMYYSKEEREKRKRISNAVYNPRIHKECDGCAGTGIDPGACPCVDCYGKGFVEIADTIS